MVIVIYLVSVWSLISYPYGLLLFIAGAYAHWALQCTKRGLNPRRRNLLLSRKRHPIGDVLQPIANSLVLLRHPHALSESVRIIGCKQISHKTRRLGIDLPHQLTGPRSHLAPKELPSPSGTSRTFCHLGRVPPRQ